MAIFALIGSAMVALSIGGFTALEQGGEHTQAEALAQEAIEAVRSIRSGAFNEIIYNQSAISTSTGEWIFDGEGTDETIGQFTRTITFEDVCRDGTDNITTCPGNYIDLHSKKVSVSVSWTIRESITNTVEKVAIISNWDSIDWIQTDWSGGTGQSQWSDSTKYDSDDGNIESSISGEVKLMSAGGGACGSKIWPFTTAGDYTYNAGEIEVAAGVARLLGSGSCSGIATACDVYGDQSSCQSQGGCSWSDGGSSGSTINPYFNTNIIGWIYNDWGQGTGEENVTGARQASGGNPGGYVNINFPSGRRDEFGGYWQQSFVTTVASPTATINFDWLISRYDPTPNTFQLYVFVDSTSGEPIIGSQVWASGEISSTSGWTSVASLDVSSSVATAGTYYVKIAVWVETSGVNTGPFTIGYDNVQLNWSGGNGSCSGIATACDVYGDQSSCQVQGGCSWSAVYPASSAINPTASYTATGIDVWSSFTETAIKNGGEIYYQLSDDDGSTWQYWNGGSWTVAGGSNYNTAIDVSANIGDFNISTEKIMFKAFLTGDGSQQVSLDEVQISWGEDVGSSGYATTGWVLSSAYDMGDVSPIQVISWDEDVTACDPACDIQLQARSAPDAGGSPGAWGSWYGGGGVGTYFTEPLGTLISTALNGNQWMQYRAELSGDGAETPIFQEIKINYK